MGGVWYEHADYEVTMIDGIAFQRGAAGAKVVEHYFIVELYLSSNLGIIIVYLRSIGMLKSALLFECSHWCEGAERSFQHSPVSIFYGSHICCKLTCSLRRS